MSDVTEKRSAPTGPAASRRGAFDWIHVAVELATVVAGILIAFAVNNWAEARRDAAIESSYLERLLADSNENTSLLQQRIDLLTHRADILARLSGWLTSGTERPSDEEISEVLCRWFVQPSLALRRETYAELASTGKLALLRDVRLRELLEQAETTYEETLRYNRFADGLQHLTDPLDRYRQWEINPSARYEVGCRFDLDGMRSDPAIPSVLAQIYRDGTLNRFFREKELAAVRAVQARIEQVRSNR